jgi:multiple sugar transport system permease protein
MAIARRPHAASRPAFYRRLHFREALDGYLFAAPSIVGFFLFVAGPMLASLYLSFTEYNIVKPPQFIGLANYIKIFTSDALFRQALVTTLYYSVVTIPLSLITALGVAILMNQPIRGIPVYRAVWYLPVLVPAAASGALWRWILNRDFGLVNNMLAAVGLPTPNWLVDPRLTVPLLVLITLWGVGGTALVLLAGLQGVPSHLYEAAELDGANGWQQFRHVTLPMMSSIIFFNLILGIIGSFQVFTVVFLIYSPTGQASAGPSNSALFYLVYLYRNAFQYFQMGYASALAWVLFLIIMVFTFLMFRFQDRWVYYETDRKR